MEIKLNSQTIHTDATSIQSLIDSLNLENNHVVVELNLKILKKETWEETTLHQGDCVEIITFMGGG